MCARSLKIWPLILLIGAGLFVQTTLRGQDAAPADAPPPPVPLGVEVMARGPVHEAFASLNAEPQPTLAVPKQPPQPLQEMPPEEKPAGDVVWMSGYWAWDDDRKDFLWVSGIWRTPPPNKQWVAGYWRQEGDSWQRVPGLWTAAAPQDAPQQVTYMPKPPPPPNIAAPSAPPSPDTFYIPGHWEWNGSTYLWRGGYWARVQPSYVWVAAHYSWTPGGYIYNPGYWDYSVKRRGVLYAPVVIDPRVVNATFVYTPGYAVRDTLLVDALFVRPAVGSYYFGDYYDVSYRHAGYTSCVVYSRDHYDSIIVHERYEHRNEPNWINVQINLSNDRFAGRAPVPARTLNQQTTIIQNTTVVNNINNSTTNITNNVSANRTVMKTSMLAPPAQVMAANGMKPVKLDSATRVAARTQAVAVQQAAVQRSKNEVAAPGGALNRPRVASLNTPHAQPVGPKLAAANAAATNRPAQTSPAARQAVAPSVSTAPRAPAVRPTTPPYSTQTSTSVNPTAPQTHPLSPATSLNPPAATTHSLSPATSLNPPAATTHSLTTRPGTPPAPGQPLARPPATLLPTRPAPPPPARRPPPKDKDKDKDKDKNQH